MPAEAAASFMSETAARKILKIMVDKAREEAYNTIKHIKEVGKEGKQDGSYS